MTTTTKAVHTPGPWELDSAKDGGCRYFQIDAPTPKELTKKPAFGYTVADTMNRHYCITPEEDEANARLIAAAPELLESLETFVAFANWEAGTVCNTEEEWDAKIAKAEAAIQKAKGGQ